MYRLQRAFFFLSKCEVGGAVDKGTCLLVSFGWPTSECELKLELLCVGVVSLLILFRIFSLPVCACV